MVDPNYSDDPGMSYEDYNEKVAAAKENKKIINDIKQIKIVVELLTRVSAHDLFVVISALCPKHNISVEEISVQSKTPEIYTNIPKSPRSMEVCLNYLIGLFKRPLTANEITVMEETYKILDTTSIIPTKDQKFTNIDYAVALLLVIKYQDSVPQDQWKMVHLKQWLNEQRPAGEISYYE
jgi:hypothetical protein